MFTDTCAENFPKFKLPQTQNVQCPQRISKKISLLSSCNGSKTSPEYNRTLSLHNCFQDIDNFKRRPNDSCFVYACFVYAHSTAKKKNYFNFCIIKYMVQKFRMSRRPEVLHPFLTICQHQKRAKQCINSFMEICLKKQEWPRFIQTCLNLLLTLCRGLFRQNRTKCKDVIENIIDNKIEEISKTTDQAYVS